MQDNFGRNIHYLRISVTDRCNLACSYCVPNEKFNLLPRSEILSFDEIALVVKSGVRAGINKVRVTGGEPFARKGIVDLLAQLLGIPGIQKLGITTNGILLGKHLGRLRELKLDNINISLDTLIPAKFEQITRKNAWQSTWNAIMQAVSLGFKNIKINVVAMKGINDDEFADFARLTMKYPVQVRFIEFMPYGCWHDRNDLFISGRDIITGIAKLGPVKELEKTSLDGPAKLFALPGSLGNIGIITAVSEHFCSSCNRLRLSADGKLRPCLYSDSSIDLKPILRAKPVKEEEIFNLFAKAIALKPARHGCSRNFAMSTIGG